MIPWSQSEINTEKAGSIEKKCVKRFKLGWYNRINKIQTLDREGDLINFTLESYPRCLKIIFIIFQRPQSLGSQADFPLGIFTVPRPLNPTGS